MSNEIIKQWGSKSLHLFIYCAFLFPLIVMLYPLTNTWDASFNKVLGAIPFLFETYLSSIQRLRKLTMYTRMFVTSRQTMIFHLYITLHYVRVV